MNAKTLKARLITTIAGLPIELVHAAESLTLSVRPGQRPVLTVRYKPGLELAWPALQKALKKNGDPHVVIAND